MDTHTDDNMLIVTDGATAVIDVKSVVRGCQLILFYSLDARSATSYEAGVSRWLLNKHLDQWTYWNLY